MDFPFYYLNPTFDNPGQVWWWRKLKPLVEKCGREEVSRCVLCVEYFPYHSSRFDRSKVSGHASLNLESQEYGFDLVREALRRKAFIVIMRSERLWLERVPALEGHPWKCTLNSVQNPAISSRNCARFREVIAAICSGKY
jgi:hypothetical protein